MNLHVKILNNTLTYVRTMQRMQGWFTTQSSISIIHHIKEQKRKVTDLLIDAEETFDGTQHPPMIKKQHNEGTLTMFVFYCVQLYLNKVNQKKSCQRKRGQLEDIIFKNQANMKIN